MARSERRSWVGFAVAILLCVSAKASADPPPMNKPVKSATTETKEVEKEEEVYWEDETTGFHYLFLKKKRTYAHAALACANRHWNLFNLKYLSAEEQGRFFSISHLRSPSLVGVV